MPHVSLRWYRLIERRAGCPGGEACANRSEIEHLRYLTGMKRERWWHYAG